MFELRFAILRSSSATASATTDVPAKLAYVEVTSACLEHDSLREQSHLYKSYCAPRRDLTLVAAIVEQRTARCQPRSETWQGARPKIPAKSGSDR